MRLRKDRPIVRWAARVARARREGADPVGQQRHPGMGIGAAGGGNIIMCLQRPSSVTSAGCGLEVWSAYGLQLRTVKTSAHAKSMAKPYDDDTDFTCVRRVVWKASAPLTSEFFGAATETVALNSARHSKSLLTSSVRLDTESVLVDLGTKRAEQTKRLRRE